MPGLVPPTQYLIYNSLQVKKLAIVVDIEGLDYITSTLIGRVLRYGDPFNYGDPGLVYGGLVPVGAAPGERGQRQLLDLNGGSLTISQRLEPEQGRASISTLNMTFIDKDKYMTRAISPGVIIPEILGREVKIWLGYAQTSFPENFYVVWRGRVSQLNPEIGRVTLQFSDPNIKKRQQVFYMGKTTLSSGILSGTTTIPVTANSDFHRKILGPDGVTWDNSARLFLKIDDEFIEYQQVGQEPTGFGTNQFLNVSRGALGSVAAAHSVNAEISAFVQLEGHAIDLALKMMLSGWGGPFLDDYSFEALAQTGDPFIPVVSNAIVLPQDVDAIRDLGVAAGDYITIASDPNPANNGLCRVLGFQDSSQMPNRLILTDKTFIASPSTPATMDVRSQYDTLPITCGSKLPGREVDVETHIFYKNTYLNDLANSYRFFLNGPIASKTFIETEIMLPIGAYCITRQGRLSMGLTKPPIADDRTTLLDTSNVLEPQTIKIQRGLNNRKYFNEINWDYDYSTAGSAQSLRKTLDTDSLSSIGLSSVLPIKSKGARTDLGFNLIVERRERFLLNRYAQGAVLIDMKTNFGAGNLVEAGDVVILDDSGNLQIPNLATGDRNIGIQLFEVINRSLDLKSGMVQLQLQGGIGSLVDDRYATISPSSLLDVGSTASQLRIKDSFGAIFPTQEWKKWEDYVGLRVLVHDANWTVEAETTFVGLDGANPYLMNLNPPLPFTPLPNYIVDVCRYPTTADPLDQAAYKLIHAFLTPSILVTSGVDNFSFNVSLSDAALFSPDRKVLIHNDSYSILSPEASVVSVVGTLITVADDLGFTPAVGQRVELIGFADFDLAQGSGGPYRYV